MLYYDYNVRNPKESSLRNNIGIYLGCYFTLNSQRFGVQSGDSHLLSLGGDDSRTPEP